MRRQAIALGTAILLAACAGTPVAPATPARSPAMASPRSTASTGPSAPVGIDLSDLAVVRHAGSGGPAIASVDATTGRVVAELPDGPIAPDGSAVFAVRAIGADTEVDALDPATGSATRYRTLPGRWALPTMGVDRTPIGLASDGSVLVLAALDPGRGRSRFAVLPAALDAAPAYVDLDGSFDVDGISPAGKTLYLVERRDGRDYAIRAADVESGSLDPQPVVDKREGGEAMVGRAVGRVVSTTWLHTLYLAEEPFLHSLDAANRFTFCIELDRAINGSNELALAVTNDGGLAWVVDLGGDQIIDVNVTNGTASTPKPLRRVDETGVATGATAAVSGPRFDPALELDASIYVGTPGGLIRIDPAMRLIETLIPRPVTGVASSPTGAIVAFLADGRARVIPR